MGLCFSDATQTQTSYRQRCRMQGCPNIPSIPQRTEGYCNRCYNQIIYQKNNYPRSSYNTTVNTTTARPFTLASPPAPNTVPAQPPPSYESVMNPQSSIQQQRPQPTPSDQDPVSCPTCNRKLLLNKNLQLVRCPFCENAFEVTRDSQGKIFTAYTVNEGDILQRRAGDSYYSDYDRYGYDPYGYAPRRSYGAGTTMLAAGGGLLGGLLLADILF